MPTLRFLLLAIAVAFGVLGVATPSAAQSVSLTLNPTTGVQYSDREARNSRRINELNREDCENQDLTFTLQTAVTGVSRVDVTVQAWVGTNCDNIVNREPQTSGGGTRCQNVFGDAQAGRPLEEGTSTRFVIPAETLADGKSCDNLPATDTDRTIYFLAFVRGNFQDIAGQASWGFRFDVGGPAPPSNISAGPGENAIIVKFKAPSGVSDVRGYRVYCEPALAPIGNQGAAGSSGEIISAGGAAGTAAAAQGGDTGVAGGASGGAAGREAESTAGSAGNAGAPAVSGNCMGANLIPGQVPSDDFLCGENNSNLAQQVSTRRNLINGQPYVVAIAAVDTSRNVGTLSALACATPEGVIDFYERYRAAGGQAGGGFCSIGAQPRVGAAFALLAAVGVFVWRRRRSAS